jgi:hypothetical protein
MDALQGSRQGTAMRHLNAVDINIYRAWLRRTAAVYAGLVLFGAAAIATLAVTKAPTAASYLAASVSLVSP